MVLRNWAGPQREDGRMMLSPVPAWPTATMFVNGVEATRTATGYTIDVSRLPAPRSTLRIVLTRSVGSGDCLSPWSRHEAQEELSFSSCQRPIIG